jgi:ribonuclease E
MKSNGDPGDGTGASGQDGPLDVVLELDLEEIDTVAADSDDADNTHDAATEVEAEWTTVAEPVEQPAVEDAPAHTEPVDVVDVVDVAEVVEPVPPIVEHTPEPVSEPTSQPSPRNEPDPYAEVVTPPSRPRRHRGRVVAPAGPPRSADPGGGTDG